MHLRIRFTYFHVLHINVYISNVWLWLLVIIYVFYYLADPAASSSIRSAPQHVCVCVFLVIVCI